MKSPVPLMGRVFFIASIWVTLAGCAGPKVVGLEETEAATAVDGTVADATRRAAAASGYSIKLKDGQVLFCQTDQVLGSHARYSTTCLTESQWQQAVREEREKWQESRRKQVRPGRLP